MSEVGTFFRTCPTCGQRFEIKLVDKKVESTDLHTEEFKHQISALGYGGRSGMRIDTGIRPTEDSKLLTIYMEESQYVYKCYHCGHEWSEKRFKEKRATGRLYPSSHTQGKGTEIKHSE